MKDVSSCCSFRRAFGFWPLIGGGLTPNGTGSKVPCPIPIGCGPCTFTSNNCSCQGEQVTLDLSRSAPQTQELLKNSF